MKGGEDMKGSQAKAAIAVAVAGMSTQGKLVSHNQAQCV
jgi:hypothetical protein